MKKYYIDPKTIDIKEHKLDRINGLPDMLFRFDYIIDKTNLMGIAVDETTGEIFGVEVNIFLFAEEKNNYIKINRTQIDIKSISDFDYTIKKTPYLENRKNKKRNKIIHKVAKKTEEYTMLLEMFKNEGVMFLELGIFMFLDNEKIYYPLNKNIFLYQEEILNFKKIASEYLYKECEVLNKTHKKYNIHYEILATYCNGQTMIRDTPDKVFDCVKLEWGDNLNDKI